MAISGCNGTAVDIRVDATGAYTSPAALANITLTANNGSSGAALYIGPAAAAALQDVEVSSNTATNGTMHAAERSNLTMTSCTISRNTGAALVFAGGHLNITASNFTSNAALPTAAATAAALATTSSSSNPVDTSVRSAGAGGAVRLLCGQLGPGGYTNVANVTGSTFSNNSGLLGGAMYCGAGSVLTLVASNLIANWAADGGGVFADRDSCLSAMINTTFANNRAQSRCVVWCGGVDGWMVVTQHVYMHCTGADYHLGN